MPPDAVKWKKLMDKVLKPGLVELLGQAHDAVEMLENSTLREEAMNQQLTWKSSSTSRRGVSTSSIQVRPFAASSTGKTSCAYSCMPRLPSHSSSATPGQSFSMSGPKYGAPFSANVSSRAERCSRYPTGVGTLITIGPRLYLTVRPRPRLKALQTSLGVKTSYANGMLVHQLVGNGAMQHVAC